MTECFFEYIDFRESVCSSVVTSSPVPGVFEKLVFMLDPDRNPTPRTAATPRPVLVTDLAGSVEGLDTLRTWFFVHGFPGDLIPELAFAKEFPIEASK